MYPDAYIDYLVYFHGPRDYFECHEVLEEYWKEDKPGERKKYWVGLIQIAVSLYHHRLGNFNGAKRLMKNAISIIQNEETAIKKLGLDYDKLLKMLNQRYTEIENKQSYKSFNLPLTDLKLLQKCKEYCKTHNCEWGDPSDLNNQSLIQKHALRDRSEVIQERLYQKELRNKTRKHR